MKNTSMVIVSLLAVAASFSAFLIAGGPMPPENNLVMVPADVVLSPTYSSGTQTGLGGSQSDMPTVRDNQLNVPTPSSASWGFRPNSINWKGTSVITDTQVAQVAAQTAIYYFPFPWNRPYQQNQLDGIKNNLGITFDSQVPNGTRGSLSFGSFAWSE